MSQSSLLERLNLQSDSSLARLVEVNSSPCFTGNAIDQGEDPRRNSETTGSRLGGIPCLSSDWPADRAGKPLMFLGQIHFADLSSENQQAFASRGIVLPTKGLLSIFWNERRDVSNPKDRHSFRFLWQDASQTNLANNSTSVNSIAATPIELCFKSEWSLELNLSDWKNQEQVGSSEIHELIESESKLSERNLCQLFGSAFEDIQKKKEVAAFACNGVSWSTARSADSCYSHLVEASHDWVLLMRLNSRAELGFDFVNTKSIAIMIHNDDLRSNRLDKAWMVY